MNPHLRPCPRCQRKPVAHPKAVYCHGCHPYHQPPAVNRKQIRTPKPEDQRSNKVLLDAGVGRALTALSQRKVVALH